jgi:hypothetical protein
MDSATFWAWVFGFASLASFFFALYVYFKSREFIYPLIEKLRASRNSFRKLEMDTRRIVMIADSKEYNPEEKVKMMRHVTRTINESLYTYMNTVDNGEDWGGLSTEEIYYRLKSNVNRPNKSLNPTTR